VRSAPVQLSAVPPVFLQVDGDVCLVFEADLNELA